MNFESTPHIFHIFEYLIKKKVTYSGSLNSRFDGENKTIPIARSVEKMNSLSMISWFADHPKFLLASSSTLCGFALACAPPRWFIWLVCKFREGKSKDQDALAVLIVPRALGQGADGSTHEEVPWSLPGSEKCKRKARDSGWDLLLYFQCFYHNNTPPTHGPTNRKNAHTHTHKNRCFFFIPAPKDRPGQPRTLLGCNHAHQVALAAPQELPVPYQVQWIRPACLPNLRFWEGKEVEKAEIKWTPVVWHSWLENHPGPFLPTPICNKTSSCFKRMHRMKQPGLDGVELSRVEGWLESILRKHEGSRSTSCCFPWNGFKSSEICDCKIWSSFWFYINVQHFESYMTLPYPISIRPF